MSSSSIITLCDYIFFQFSVTLQSEEEIAADSRRWAKQASSVISYSKHHEVCLSLKYSQLILPIPLHTTPAFSTPLGKYSIPNILIKT